MNWIDNVLAVPAIGIRINTKFGVVAEFQKVLYYFLDGLAKELDDLQILPEELWGFKAESKNGYSFNYSSKNLVTSFKYNIGRKRKPGKLPTLTAPELMSYSELLNKLLKYKKEIIKLLKDFKGVEFDRIGIVAATNLDSNSIPPGLNTWLDYLGKPWGNELHEANINLWTKIDERNDFIERCNHSIVFEQEMIEETGYKFVMDWQRLFSEKKVFEYKDLNSNLDNCIENAFAYFEKFGEGDLNYD